MSDPTGQMVQRRRVFFVPGFDPFPPRRYRELYRAQGTIQSDQADYSLKVGGGDHHGQWSVVYQDQDQTVHTQFDLLDWSDLVREEVDRSRAQVIWAGLRCARTYLTSGAFSAILQLRRGPALVSLFPYLVLILWALLWAVLLWNGVGVVGAHWPVLTPIVVAVLLGAEFLAFKVLDQRLFLGYLLSDFAFWARHRGAYPAPLEDRIRLWEAQVAEALCSSDEVLIVGHSSGALLAVSVLAGLVDKETRQPELLTLGQTVPMVSLLPEAHRARADLRTIGATPGVTWVDISAPGDPCCFALCDPLAVSGAGPADVPLILSAAFRQSLSQRTRARLRWRFRRLHSQYLFAFDDPTGFDYFRTTAGPAKLREVFANRRPSSQRQSRSVLPKQRSK